MAEKDRRLDFVIAASDQATPVLRGVNKELDAIAFRVSAAAAKAASAGGGFFPSIHSLKQTLGGRGTVKDIAELFVGGGALAGATFALNALSEATRKAVDLADAFHDGKISAGQMFDEIMKSIPILGRAWEIGRNIRELITHEERDARELERHDIEHLRYVQSLALAWNEGVKTRQEYVKLSEEIIRQKDTATATTGLPGSAATIISDFAAYEDALRRINDEAEERKKKATGNNRRQIIAEIDEETGRRIDAEKRLFNERKQLFTSQDKYFKSLAQIEKIKVNAGLSDADVSRLQFQAYREAYGTGDARSPFSMFQKLVGGAGQAAQGLLGNVADYAGWLMLNRKMDSPAITSTALPSLVEGRGSGLREQERDRLAAQAHDDRREQLRLERKRTEDAQKTREAITKIANWLPNAINFKALFAPK